MGEAVGKRGARESREGVSEKVGENDESDRGGGKVDVGMVERRGEGIEKSGGS